jgi:dihydroneopterin aldolase
MGRYWNVFAPVASRDSTGLFGYISTIITSRPMDIIYLHDLKIECIIGIWEWERRVKQTIILDLDMAADIRRAAATDRIDDTLNYKAVAKRLIDFVGNSQFQLVETLAEKIAEILLAEFKLKWVRVRVNKKGAVRGAGDVGIIIERGEV